MTNYINNKDVYAEIPLVKESNGKYYLMVGVELGATGIKAVFISDGKKGVFPSVDSKDVHLQQLVPVVPGNYVLVHYYTENSGEFIVIRVTQVGKTARGIVECDLHTIC